MGLESEVENNGYLQNDIVQPVKNKTSDRLLRYERLMGYYGALDSLITKAEKEEREEWRNREWEIGAKFYTELLTRRLISKNDTKVQLEVGTGLHMHKEIPTLRFIKNLAPMAVVFGSKMDYALMVREVISDVAAANYTKQERLEQGEIWIDRTNNPRIIKLAKKISKSDERAAVFPGKVRVNRNLEELFAILHTGVIEGHGKFAEREEIVNLFSRYINGDINFDDESIYHRLDGTDYQRKSIRPMDELEKEILDYRP